MPSAHDILAIALAAACVGCGPPSLYDVAGRRITHPALMAPIDGGWLAVDTTGSRTRAVVEIYVPADPAMTGPPPLNLALVVGPPGRPLYPTRVRRGAPDCFRVEPARQRCDESRADSKACPWRGGQLRRQCYYPIRAEFALTEYPSLSDLVVLRVDPDTRFVLTFR